MRALMFSLLVVSAGSWLLFAGLGDGKASDLVLEDTVGRKHALAVGKETRGTVFLFLGAECPAVRRYLPRVIDLHKEFAAAGFTFYAVYSNALEEKAEIAKHAQENGLPFPALLDPEQRAADAFLVQITPTAVLVGPEGKVRYRGAIDDHKTEKLAKKPYLRLALEAVRAGREVAVASTEPVGCTLQRKRPATANAPVTYSSHIAGILHQQCVTCHRPGQVAPFSLLTYEQSRRWADDIKTFTQSRAMPPWKPTNHGAFRGERRLTPEQIDLLAQWVDAGAPPGDLAKAPAPPKFPEGWALGEPDLILEAPAYDVEPVGADEYRCFVLDPKQVEDRYVQAVEFKPGNSRIVHHVMTYIDGFGASVEMDARDPKPGYSSRGTGPGFLPLGDLGGWGPGMQPIKLEDGTASLLPAGAKIVLEVHYHKNGRPEKDRTRFGLHFAKQPVRKVVRTHVVLNLRLRIPPGEKRYPIEAEWKVPEDLHAIAIAPHMHLIGKEIRATAHYPDGREQTLVHVQDWDFNWQEIYHFAKPHPLPKGTRIHLIGWFDNSADNPNNPNQPPRLVRFGEETTDEMCVAYVAYTRDAGE